jgi:formyltetrahydrofolate deformylase
METAVILIRCPDRKGIVAKISEFVYHNDGNIIQSDQYTTDSESGMFFMRLEFCFDETQIIPGQLESSFSTLARELLAQWEIHYKSKILRMGILVSKQDHCLFDILYRWKSGELKVNIPFVISNHRVAEELVWQFNVDFQYFSAVDLPKDIYEQHIVKCVSGTTDFLVLARYMQILSTSFLEQYRRDIINIHHSFLPSFKGANPYKQAYERGVKVIGATAHYVTEDLDEGPIIDQVVESVSHRDSVDDLVRKGRNLEKMALANALHAHIDHRIIRYKNKTVVFM